MSSKYSIFVDELMIRIIFVVNILREYADSRKFWRQQYHNRGCAQQRNIFETIQSIESILTQVRDITM